MAAIFRIVISILINFTLSLLFSLISFSGTKSFNIPSLLIFFIIILCTIGLIEMRWINRSFQQSSYLKSFLTLNSLNFFTPIFAALLIALVYEIYFTLEFFFTDTVLKWYFINALLSGIFAFFFNKKEAKSSLHQKESEILDEDFLN